MASSSYDFSSDTLNLEDLKAQLGQSCMTCGVSWLDDQFSFDCAECGGFALTKPCQLCSGKCGNLWTREFSMVNIITGLLLYSFIYKSFFLS